MFSFFRSFTEEAFEIFNRHSQVDILYVRRQQKWDKKLCKLKDNLNSTVHDFIVIILSFKYCFLPQFSSAFQDILTPAIINIIRCDSANCFMVTACQIAISQGHKNVVELLEGKVKPVEVFPNVE